MLLRTVTYTGTLDVCTCVIVCARTATTMTSCTSSYSVFEQVSLMPPWYHSYHFMCSDLHKPHYWRRETGLNEQAKSDVFYTENGVKYWPFTNFRLKNTCCSSCRGESIVVCVQGRGYRAAPARARVKSTESLPLALSVVPFAFVL